MYGMIINCLLALALRIGNMYEFLEINMFMCMCTTKIRNAQIKL